MKKICYFFLFGAMLVSLLLFSCSYEVWEDESAENLFKAIANDDPHAFNWITAEEVDKLNSEDQEKHDQLRTFVSDIDKNVPPLLAKWREEGKNVGIDWKNIEVDTVVVTSWGDSNANELGVPAHEGYIMAKSNGKKFEIRFDQAIEHYIGEGWRMIDITGIMPVEE